MALVSVTPRRFGSRTPSVMGWQLAAGSAGVGIGPALVAVGVDASGPGAVAPWLVAIAAVMVVAHLVVRRHIPPGAALVTRPERDQY